MQANSKIFHDKNCAIETINEMGKDKENHKNLFLKLHRYGNNGVEYSIIEESQVLQYDSDHFIGHFDWIKKAWITFDPGDRINIPQTEAKRKEILVFPDLQIERSGFCE